MRRSCVFAVAFLTVCLAAGFLVSASATVYVADALTLEVGTDLVGVAADLDVGNSNVVSAAEMVGVPDCLVLRVDYVVPDLFFNLSVNAFLWYDGNPAHDVAVQLYNNTLLGWQTISYAYDALEFSWVNASFTGAAGLSDFVDDGNFSVRFYHADNGVAGHVLYVDTLIVDVDDGMYVSYVVGAGGGLTVNGSFVGNGTVVYPSGDGLLLAAYPDVDFSFGGFDVDGVVYGSNPFLFSPVNGSSVEVLFAADGLSGDDAFAAAVVFGLLAFAGCGGLAVYFFYSRRSVE